MPSRKVLMHLTALVIGSLAALPAAGQTTKINVGYTAAADFVPLFVAKDKGFFDKRGLDATLTRIQIASNVPPALVSGSLQIGMGTTPILLQSAEGGLDLVLVNGASRFKKTNPMSALIARPGVRIAAAGDLRGKKVGVPGFNSFFDVLLRKWLLTNNVALKEVTFVEAAFPQMKDLLKGGTLDAVVAIEPFRNRITSDGTGTAVVDYISEVNPDILGAFFMATGDWASKNAQAIRAFREAYAEGIGYAQQNAAEAKTLEAKYLGIAGPVTPSYAMEVSPADLEVYAGYGRDIGMLRQAVDVKKLIFK